MRDADRLRPSQSKRVPQLHEAGPDDFGTVE
jgi:hypothetical protein